MSEADRDPDLEGTICGLALRVDDDQVIRCELEAGHVEPHASGSLDWDSPILVCSADEHNWLGIVLGCTRCGTVHDEATGGWYEAMLQPGWRDQIGPPHGSIRLVPERFGWPPTPPLPGAPVIDPEELTDWLGSDKPTAKWNEERG